MACTSRENIRLYFDLINELVLGNVHGNNILMIIPLKTASNHVTLHRVIVLPTRILENMFIAYEHDYDYLALLFNQRDFALLKEADLKTCRTGILTVCPINIPLYDAKVPACDAELFFQTS